MSRRGAVGSRVAIPPSVYALIYRGGGFEPRVPLLDRRMQDRCRAYELEPNNNDSWYLPPRPGYQGVRMMGLGSRRRLFCLYRLVPVPSLSVRSHQSARSGLISWDVAESLSKVTPSFEHDALERTRLDCHGERYLVRTMPPRAETLTWKLSAVPIMDQKY